VISAAQETTTTVAAGDRLQAAAPHALDRSSRGAVVKLAGTRAVVTGCSTGIGQATAAELARRGSEVWATTRNPTALGALASAAVHVVQLDLTSAREVEKVIKEIGVIDILINNAGYGVEGAVEEVDDKTLRAQYETNVFAPWRMCRAVLPGMRARARGAIVNVSSFGAHAPFPGIGAYRSSKFALEGMTWTLHLEVAHFGIRVIAVEPGLVDTSFNENAVMAQATAAPADPYGEMRELIGLVYSRMSPSALPAKAVATRIADELAAEDGPLHIRIGEDAERMIAAVAAGEREYHRYLAEDLGFTWLPLGRPDTDGR
jgi:NAD(P)-dependent dehydrogenase (short-subunit alcohol dehydrogenase family)